MFIITNSVALDINKPNITLLNNLSVPDKIIFFDDKGNKYSLDQFEGKTILLVFWATWCAACVKEMPDLDVLQKDFRKLPFTIVPISQDHQGIKIVQEYFKNHAIRYLPIYHDYKNQLFKAFSIIGLPTSILINQNGMMVASFVGYINWYDDSIRNIILSHIPGNYPKPTNSYKKQSLHQLIKPLKLQEKEIMQESVPIDLQRNIEQSVIVAPQIRQETQSVNTSNELQGLHTQDKSNIIGQDNDTNQ